MSRRLLAAALASLAVPVVTLAAAGAADPEPHTFKVSVIEGTTHARAVASEVSVSTDGRYVLFQHWDEISMPEAQRNMRDDLYRRDTVLGRTELVTGAADGDAGGGGGTQGAMSLDGAIVAFRGVGNDLVEPATDQRELYGRDLRTRETTLLTPRDDADTAYTRPRLSGDGRYAVYTAYRYVPTDQRAYVNEVWSDAYRVEIATGQRTLLSPRVGETRATGWVQPSISADGSTILLTSTVDDLAPGGGQGLFVWRPDGIERLAAELSGVVDLSDDGGVVLYTSTVPAGAGETAPWTGLFVRRLEDEDPVLVRGATGERLAHLGPAALVGDGGEVYVSAGSDRYTQRLLRFDVATATSTVASTTPTGAPADGFTEAVAVARDGSGVAFTSTSADLVPGTPADRAMRLYYRDLETGRTIIVCCSQYNDVRYPRVSGDGSTVLFDHPHDTIYAGRTAELLAPPPPPTTTTTLPPTVSAVSRTVSETNSRRTVPVTISLSHAASSPITVNVTTAGGLPGAMPGLDYEETVASVTIPAGATQATVDVPILGDRVPELDESFTVTIASCACAGAAVVAPTATVKIVDDDLRV